MDHQRAVRERREAADALAQVSGPSNFGQPSTEASQDEHVITPDNGDDFPHSPSPNDSSQEEPMQTDHIFPSVLPTSALPPPDVLADQGGFAELLNQVFGELMSEAQDAQGDPGEGSWNEPVYSAPSGDGQLPQAPREIEDNLRQTRSSLFEQDDDSEAPSNPIPLDDIRSVQDLAPQAFEEDPILRNIYIRAYVQAAFHGATHADIANLLTDQRATLTALSEREGFDLELSNMALTLRTVERRLGLSVDDQIVYYFICPICWDVHHPNTLSNLEDPICRKSGGELYIESTRDGKKKRTPTKILQYASLSSYIRRMLLRPGKIEELQSWRQDGDEAALKPPQSFEEWQGLELSKLPSNGGSTTRGVRLTMLTATIGRCALSHYLSVCYSP